MTEHSNPGRKRTGVPDTFDATEDDISGKRARSSPGNLERSGNEMNKRQDRSPSSGTTLQSDVDSGPVQQLVTMFAALVAQGEKAATSLEILISSISADLLAEVVMANIRNLPLTRPKSEGEEELLTSAAAHHEMVGSDTHINYLSLLLKDKLLQSSPSQEMEIGKGDSELEARIILSFNLVVLRFNLHHLLLVFLYFHTAATHPFYFSNYLAAIVLILWHWVLTYFLQLDFNCSKL